MRNCEKHLIWPLTHRHRNQGWEACVPTVLVAFYAYYTCSRVMETLGCPHNFWGATYTNAVNELYSVTKNRQLFTAMQYNPHRLMRRKCFMASLGPHLVLHVEVMQGCAITLVLCNTLLFIALQIVNTCRH